jgi:phosphoserine phosphatase RsbU/P
VNAALAEGNAGCMFVTFVLATLHVASGRLTYVRAGHIPPYHRNGAGTVARLDRLSGPPLGLDEGVKYKPETVTLAAGDRLLVVTDGFTEANDPAGALYGDQKVVDFVTTLKPSEPDPLKRLLNDVRKFEAGRPASDDTAAILLSLGP